MKRLIYIFLILSVISSLTGCKEAVLQQPAFPLEKEVVDAALEQTGLSGNISESETQSNREGHVLYTLRDQTESKAMIAAVSSALTEGERFLQINFISSSVPEQSSFAWGDWKQQLVFATLLYGGFSDEEEVYRTFAEKEVSEGEILQASGGTQSIAERLEWDARLPAGYCRVSYQLCGTDIESSSLGNKSSELPPIMSVTIYESESLYKQMRQERTERKEALENTSTEVIN